MRINNINKIPNYNRKQKVQDLSFKSKKEAYKIKRAVLKGIESKTIYEKASSLLNKLPKCKMESTYICTVNNKKYGIRWDTRNENKFILKVKDNIDTNDTVEWEKNKVNQTVLECIFDKNGIMYNGSITKYLKKEYSLNALYDRDYKGYKTIQMDGITYRPCKNDDEYWESIPIKSCYSIKKDICLHNQLDETELSELFCALVTKNTTIK